MPENDSMMNDGTMTVKQAVAFTGLSRTTLYELMDEGRLYFVRFGAKRTRLIPRRALVGLLETVAAEQPG